MGLLSQDERPCSACNPGSQLPEPHCDTQNGFEASNMSSLSPRAPGLFLFLLFWCFDRTKRQLEMPMTALGKLRGSHRQSVSTFYAIRLD